MKAWISLTVAALACFTTPGRADTVAPLPADGRLVYVHPSAPGCELRLWSTADGSDRVLTTLPECPKGMDVTSGGRALVLLDKADIRLFTFSDGTLGAPIALPRMDAPKGTDGAGSTQAGYAPDGKMALEMVADHPDDSQELFLFIRNGDTWTQEEHIPCGRFGTDCGFKQTFDSHPIGDALNETDPRQVWSDGLRGDPYVVQRIPEMITEQTAGYDGEPLHNTLAFHVYGRYSKLVFDTQAGDDTDGIYTFRLSLVTPDERTLDITDDQFDAAVVGHYLLFYGYFDAGTRLYDLGDGKVVLGGLSLAGWLP